MSSSNEMLISNDGDFMDTAGAVLRPMAGQALQKVGNQYATAIQVQQPRDLNKIKKAVLAEAMLGGETMYYSWSVKSKDKSKSIIEGPSINLAMSIARNFGNCSLECDLEELPDAWIFTGRFIDLETGFNFKRLFRMSRRTGASFKTNEERQQDIVFQVGQSKAIRNAVIAAAPKAIVDQAMEAAKKGVTAKIEKSIRDHSLPKVQDAAVAALKKVGVVVEAILERFDIAEIKGLTVEHLTLMHGDIATINAGIERGDDLYPAPTGKDEQADKVKEKIKQPTAKKEEKPVEKEQEVTTPPADEVRENKTEEVQDSSETPEWVEQRRGLYNTVTAVDRMRLPLGDLYKEYKKADDTNKAHWSYLIDDACDHMLKLCTKVSVIPMAISQLKTTLKDYPGLDIVVEAAEAKQVELQGK